VSASMKPSTQDAFNARVKNATVAPFGLPLWRPIMLAEMDMKGAHCRAAKGRYRCSLKWRISRSNNLRELYPTIPWYALPKEGVT